MRDRSVALIVERRDAAFGHDAWMRRFFFCLPAIALLTAQACGASSDDASVAPEADASTEASVNDASASTDADSSAGDATSADVATDASSTTDAVSDSSSDALADATSDALTDGAADAPADAPADAAKDAACTPPQVDVGHGCVTPLVLFRGDPASGALGGRAGADALCAAARPALSHAPASSVAFISVAADDEIRDLPGGKGFATDVPIVGPTGKVIATEWADLLDGTIARSLSAADVLTGTDTFWYSGSDKTGAVTSKTCTGWTAASTLFDASYGINSATDEGWIRQSGEATCGLSSYSVLCIGY